MTPRDTRDEVIALLEQTERHCPCGARPESPQTHPHVIGCPLEKALVMLRDQGVADDELGMQFLSQRLRIAELEALLRAPETPQHEWVGPSMHESTCRKCGISHAEFRAGVADRCLFRAPETQERGWQDERGACHGADRIVAIVRPCVLRRVCEPDGSVAGSGVGSTPRADGGQMKKNEKAICACGVGVWFRHTYVCRKCGRSLRRHDDGRVVCYASHDEFVKAAEGAMARHDASLRRLAEDR